MIEDLTPSFHPYSRPGQTDTILSLVERQIDRRPNSPAITFLRNGDIPDGVLTYSELGAKARQIAACLVEASAKPGDRALIVTAEGLDFITTFLGCLYAGVIAVPVPAPDALRGKLATPRLLAIAADAGASYMLTTSSLADRLPTVAGTVLYIDQLTQDRCADLVTPYATPNDLAYLQYTSGSTGAPKGVMITHRNVVGNIRALGMVLNYQSDSVSLSWMPHTHDFGLVEGLLRPLCEGVPNYIMSPGAFVRQPLRWLRAISTHKVTHSAGATFAYQQCIVKAEFESLAGIDLSTWRVAPVGAEPIRAELMSLFSETFERFGFRRTTLCPCYGLAEGTLMVTASGYESEFACLGRVIDGRSIVLTGCGQVWDDVDIAIVNPETLQRSTTGDTGEIWVSGSSVSPGYWNRTEDTKLVFGFRLDEDAGRREYMRTGDLGFLESGQLFVTGRLKDLIIIHGQNYYPSDIEWCVDAVHPALLHGARAAFALAPTEHSNGVERLAIVCEVTQKGLTREELGQVVQEIRNSIAESFQLSTHEIYLVKRGSLLKTPSGKIQRQATKRAIESGEITPLYVWSLTGNCDSPGEHEPELTNTQKVLLGIWSDILGIENIALDDDFFALGGQSLAAVAMVERLRRECSCEIELQDFAFLPTIRKLAHFIEAKSISTALPINDNTDLQSSHSTQYQLPDEEEQHAVRQVFKQLIQPDAYVDMPDISLRPRINSRLLQTITRLPYRQACLMIRVLSSSSWATQRYWSSEVKLIMEFHRLISTSHELSTVCKRSLYYGLLNRYGLDLSMNGIPPVSNIRLARIENMEILEAARVARRGVIIASHHSHGNCWLPKVESDRLSRHAIFGLDRLVESSGIQKYERVLNARQYEIALKLLEGGEVVMLQPDGRPAQTPDSDRPFHGKMRSFSDGFARLAIAAGAQVIHLQSEINVDGDVCVRLLAPMDSGSPAMTEGDRVCLLADQYRDNLSATWERSPWSVMWNDMSRHLEHRSVN